MLFAIFLGGIEDLIFSWGCVVTDLNFPQNPIFPTLTQGGQLAPVKSCQAQLHGFQISDKSGSPAISLLLPGGLLVQPGFQRLRQLADQQRVPAGYPSVNGAGRFSLQGFIKQCLGGNVVVDQAEFVL